MVQVEVNEGILEGEKIAGCLNNNFYSFKGIPYAQPPLGDLRFKAPQPAKPWKGVREAKQHGPICRQYDIWSQKILEGTEDCLYLNVYSPDIKPTASLPVMVWIHGGAFTCGSGNSDFYGPDLLVKRGVVVVTINYRLEIIGFLSLDTQEIPGNAGMKDQVAALKWIQKNIHNFGGNPNNVTIFGESAGGCCVAFHLVSPMSKGLFKRAIAQSGSSYNYWAISNQPRQKATCLAKYLGCESENDKELYEFFKTIPYEKISALRMPITLSEETQQKAYLHFSITDEKIFGDNERFFYGDIFDKMKEGIHHGVEVMAGYVADEGYLNFGLVPLNHCLLQFNKCIESFCPMRLVYKLPINEQKEIGKLMKQRYYGFDWDISKNNLKPLAEFLAFSIFVFDIMQWARSCSKFCNVYLYKFFYKSERNVMVKMFGAENSVDEPIACHVDDLMYLFNNPRADLKVDTKLKSYETIKNMTSLWTNFAKFGNPTPDDSLEIKWLPYTVNKQHYLAIDDKLSLCTSPDNEEMKFWELIFKRFYPINLYNN